MLRRLIISAYIVVRTDETASDASVLIDVIPRPVKLRKKSVPFIVLSR